MLFCFVFEPVAKHFLLLAVVPVFRRKCWMSGWYDNSFFALLWFCLMDLYRTRCLAEWPNTGMFAFGSWHARFRLIGAGFDGCPNEFWQNWVERTRFTAGIHFRSAQVATFLMREQMSVASFSAARMVMLLATPWRVSRMSSDHCNHLENFQHSWKGARGSPGATKELPCFCKLPQAWAHW